MLFFFPFFLLSSLFPSLPLFPLSSSSFFFFFFFCRFCISVGLSDSSVSKEFACNAEDPGSIPGLGRSAGEGIGYPLQHPWASLMAQLVKNLPSVQESWVRFLGWEDPLEKGTVTHSSILAWRIPRTVRGSWGHKIVSVLLKNWITFCIYILKTLIGWLSFILYIQNK